MWSCRTILCFSVMMLYSIVWYGAILIILQEKFPVIQGHWTTIFGYFFCQINSGSDRNKILCLGPHTLERWSEVPGDSPGSSWHDCKRRCNCVSNDPMAGVIRSGWVWRQQGSSEWKSFRPSSDTSFGAKTGSDVQRNDTITTHHKSCTYDQKRRQTTHGSAHWISIVTRKDKKMCAHDIVDKCLIIVHSSTILL